MGDLMMNGRRQGTKVRVVNRTRDQTIIREGELAASLWSRLRGLIGRQPLKAGQGLLIHHCNGVHTFGMGFPIDVVFTDASGQVIHLASHVPPQHFGPVCWRAAVILELPSGTINETGTRPGDKFEFDDQAFEEVTPFSVGGGAPPSNGPPK